VLRTRLADGAAAVRVLRSAGVLSPARPDRGFKVPRDVTFVDELPCNATGKVLRRELAGDAS
jgi:acyl-coenzyme A synthetase/AMP-(fatty) acid ligase